MAHSSDVDRVLHLVSLEVVVLLTNLKALHTLCRLYFLLLGESYNGNLILLNLFFSFSLLVLNFEFAGLLIFNHLLAQSFNLLNDLLSFTLCLLLFLNLYGLKLSLKVSLLLAFFLLLSYDVSIELIDGLLLLRVRIALGLGVADVGFL